MARKLTNPYLTTTSPEDLPPAQRLAFDIVDRRADLAPSVARIMNAGLGDDALVALELFERSLTTPGDANRDPAIAVERAREGGR